MALEIIHHDNRFLAVGQGISFDWLPDTQTNRKTVLIFLWLTDGLLSDQEGLERDIFLFDCWSGVVPPDLVALRLHPSAQKVKFIN